MPVSTFRARYFSTHFTIDCATILGIFEEIAADSQSFIHSFLFIRKLTRTVSVCSDGEHKMWNKIGIKIRIKVRYLHMNIEHVPPGGKRVAK